MVQVAQPSRSRGVEVALDVLRATLSVLVATGLGWLALRLVDPNRPLRKLARERQKELARKLGRVVTLNSYEEVIALDVVNPDEVSVTFDSIGGLDGIKEDLIDRIVHPLKDPHMYIHSRLLNAPKGILLYGPPGTGKTMLAKALARESRAIFINVRVSQLMSKWFGDAQKLVAAVFSLAEKLEPSIIFIDEVDAFLGIRGRNSEHESSLSMKTEFMSLWDGFATSAHASVVVLAATNRPGELDPAILRRFECSFEVPMPAKEQRVQILRVILQDEQLDADVDLGKLGERTAGFSGSDLQSLAKRALRRPVREARTQETMGDILAWSAPRRVNMADFEAELEEKRPMEQAEEFNSQSASKRESAVAERARVGAVDPESPSNVALVLPSDVLATALARAAVEMAKDSMVVCDRCQGPAAGLGSGSGTGDRVSEGT